MKKGSRKNIPNPSKGMAYIGFVERTLGGFYRGYSHIARIGYGPFVSESAATAWVLNTATAY